MNKNASLVYTLVGTKYLMLMNFKKLHLYGYITTYEYIYIVLLHNFICL